MKDPNQPIANVAREGKLHQIRVNADTLPVLRQLQKEENSGLYLHPLRSQWSILRAHRN